MECELGRILDSKPYQKESYVDRIGGLWLSNIYVMVVSA